MKNKTTRRNIIFNIYSSVLVFLSVYVYALLSKLEGDPSIKLLTDVLIIFLLVALNTTVLVLYEMYKSACKRNS